MKKFYCQNIERQTQRIANKVVACRIGTLNKMLPEKNIAMISDYKLKR